MCGEHRAESGRNEQDALEASKMWAEARPLCLKPALHQVKLSQLLAALVPAWITVFRAQPWIT